MRRKVEASAALLGALLLAGCNQTAGEADAASAQAFASTQTAQQVAEQLSQAVSGAWDPVTDQDGSAIFVSPSSYHLLGGSKVAFAEKVTGKASAPDPVTINIVELDCADNSQTMAASFGLDADGKVVGAHAHMFRVSESPTTTISPGMVGWTIAEPFCKTLGLGG